MFKPKKENEEQQVSIPNLSQPVINNDFNIITLPKKHLLESQSPESVTSTSSAIHCRSLPTPKTKYLHVPSH